MADQVSDFYLIEPVSFLLYRITLGSLAIGIGEPRLFSAELEISDRQRISTPHH
ncbi:hypothetical protein [Pseudomonas sp. 37 R 15]|uniref:hypothetical protein n=1 Tax=Pseudomonas sp. 37 R 15 TaxID=1844104 RepID=UPI0021146F6C|nr:hypothetical protein [Pseudomonas sp. 37 R 15]